MDKRLIGIGEASRVLGLSTSRVRQLVELGALSAELTPGGHRRFRPDLLRQEWSALRQSAEPPVLWRKGYSLPGLAEDQVWHKLRAELERHTGGELSGRARNILGYAVTEMVNNAIDHSHGSAVEVSLAFQNRTTVRVRVADDGIGAFRSLADTFGYSDVADAVVDLTKGRRTSAPQRHSGEGIFFTSKAVDLFSLDANGYRFTVDTSEGDVALGEGAGVGTTVTFTLDLHTSRDLVDVFVRFTEGGDFVRTIPRVQLVQHGSEFLSRSQAKRFALGLEQFEQVVLDFTGVELVGQGFADELFRVWQSAHPEVTLMVTGANRGVALMIDRVVKP
ncbi:STAS-like domain-containing protein [Micropruina sp.]|uniref:STAS-like domain-containing protein n=1 Tax=Micropruina sp. TaxID=2737536 RepID=UPI0039E39BAC